MVRVNNLMQDPEWWAYALNSTIPRSPEWASEALLPACSCVLPGVQPSELYSLALRRIASGTLSSTAAKNLLTHAKCMRKWKLATPETKAVRENEALDGFIHRNDAARSLFSAETIPWAIASGMRKLLADWLPETEPGIGRFGPGACAERWTRAKRFTRLAQWSVLPHWPEVPGTHADMGAHVCRLCAVPKQYDKDRLITVEPAYRTFAQQMIRDALLESIHKGPLRGTCMDLGFTDGQRIQQRLALRASRDGVMATLDLKDASDNITWNDVQNVFPGWVVRNLEVTRSDSFTDPRDKSIHPMAIFAGMGNATTFVVETLFFSAYVKAFAWTRGLKTRVSVFGDDIICSSKVAQALIEDGQSPCFVVNADKSFLGSDAMRESCGIFAYKGEDISVPRIDGYPDTPAGAEALADLGRRMYRDNFYWPLLSAVCAESGLPVTRRWILGFPTLVNPFCDCDVDEELEQSVVYNRDLQETVVKVEWWEPKVDLYRVTDVPLEWFTYGLLLACLLGQARTVRRGASSYVSFAGMNNRSDAWQRKKRWHVVLPDCPPSADDLLAARKGEYARMLRLTSSTYHQ